MSRAGADPTRSDAHTRILDAADRLFYRDGIQNVGVDAVAAAADVSKRTLYRHFGSKGELVAAYLARRAAIPDRDDAPPLTMLLENFESLERWFGHPRFRGCAFVNAVTEIGAEPAHPAVMVAATLKARRRSWYERQLRALQVPQPAMLAEQLVILFEGAIATSLVRGGDPQVARAAREAAAALLRVAGVDLPAPDGDRPDPRSAPG